MKLLYIYIQDFGELLKNQDFEFSNEYIVNYVIEKQQFSISKNPNYIDGFYGKVISDITAIVGVNGVGKTTLLNLIGRNLKDRIELSNINKSRKIIDKYFMIYHVKDNIFYFEGVGNIEINNLDGYNELLMRNRTVFNSFYFECDNNKYEITEYDNEVNDKIVYINSDYLKSSSDLKDLNISKDGKGIFLPRILGNSLSLVEWYKVYVDLFNEKMVNSAKISMLFNKNEMVKKSEFFVFEPTEKWCTYQVDERLTYTQENIQDFFSHFISCIVYYYVQLSSKVCEKKCHYEWNKLRDKYSGKISFSKSVYNDIFQECINIIERNASIIAREEVCAIIEYIKNVSNLFFAIYDIKEHLIPGINEFQLRLSGAAKNKKIESFFSCYMKMKDFIDYNFGNHRVREDFIYYEDIGTFKYHGNNLNLENPIDLCRVNLSTGEKNLIELLSKIAHEVRNYCKIQQFRITGEKKTYIILVDEIEATMHLEWSRVLLEYIIKYLERQTLDLFEKSFTYEELGIKVQLVFTTHSPFLLSDLNSSSIIALELKDRRTKKKSNISSFAQNIQRVMNNEFFIKDCYGEFAQNKVQEIIKRLNSDDELNDDEKVTIKLTIDEIGEPLLKNKLIASYMGRIKNESDISYEELTLVNKLKDIYGDLNNVDIVEKIRLLLKD